MSRRNASEFADETEWYQYHQPLLTGTQTIAAILVKHQPASVWQVISTWTQTCLQSAIQQAQAAAASSSMYQISGNRRTTRKNDANRCFSCVSSGSTQAQWSSHVSVLGNVVKQTMDLVTKPAPVGATDVFAPTAAELAQVNTLMMALLESFLNWQPTEYGLLSVVSAT
jgi:leucyl aminopeptidase